MHGMCDEREDAPDEDANEDCFPHFLFCITASAVHHVGLLLSVDSLYNGENDAGVAGDFIKALSLKTLP
jgi:hypothetical protein